MPFCPRCHAMVKQGELACWQCGHGLNEKLIYRADYSPQDLLNLGLSPKFVEFVFLDPKRACMRALPRDFLLDGSTAAA
jgi:hypothetical protein